MSRTDGGTATGDEPSPFETTADVKKTPWERYRTLLDKTVLSSFRILWNDWRSRFGLITVVFYVFVGTVAVEFIAAPTSNQVDTNLLMPFQNMAHPLGSDGFGQDMISLLVHATPPMLKMVFAGAVFSTMVATVVGTLSGYKGGRVDRVLTTLTDAMMALPGLPLIMVIAHILQPESPYIVGIVISVNRWAGLARSLRSEVLTLRDASYVEAARFMGISTPKILGRDIIPNLMPYITVNFVGAARGVIFGSVALYFLGILPSNVENWGVTMNRAYTSGGSLYIVDTAHWLIFPMLAIIWLSLGLIFLAQGADKIFNVRLKARHSKAIETDHDR